MTGAVTAILVPLGLYAFCKFWLLPKYGNHTLACFFGKHDWCDRHLRCGCHHHDEVIHNEMAR